MSNPDDISGITFESRVFPTQADIRRWNELSSDQQRAVIAQELDEARKSGVSTETHDEIFQRALAQLEHAG